MKIRVIRSEVREET
jgi:hypothetical protein